MSTDYPTFQNDPILNSVSASLATINVVTASAISASSYVGLPAGGGGESAIYIGNKTISGSLSVSSSINTLLSVTSSKDINVNGITIGRGLGNYPTNIVFGINAFSANEGGTDNIAIGNMALNKNKSNTNIAVGNNCLSSNISGSRNITVGYECLKNITRGDDNIAIGYTAGNESLLTSINSSVIIGKYGGFDINGTTGSIVIADGNGNARIRANNAGVVSIPGALTVSGNVILGDASSDIVTSTAQLTASNGISGSLGLFTRLTASSANITGTLFVSGGLRFPAMQIDSTDPNTLDDYEEGTWTPEFSASTTSDFTYTMQTGSYTIIGRNITATWYIALSSTGSSAGTVYINLPVAPANISGSGIIQGTLSGSSNYRFMGTPINISNTYIPPLVFGGPGLTGTTFTVATLGNNTSYNFTAHYRIS